MSGDIPVVDVTCCSSDSIKAKLVWLVGLSKLRAIKLALSDGDSSCGGTYVWSMLSIGSSNRLESTTQPGQFRLDVGGAAGATEA
jgi:hypothetical protein